MKNIVIKGAKTNNLKNVSVTIPKNKLVVITGLSGSGKSSLAFDTVYAEGQRRYVENLSSYAKQVLGVLDKPDIEYAEGLSPAIAIDQKTVARSPRSTVATLTEIFDYLRILFSRIGIPKCPTCSEILNQYSKETIIKRVLEYETIDGELYLIAPLSNGNVNKSQARRLIQKIKQSKYDLVRINNEFISRNDLTTIDFDEETEYSIDVVTDIIKVNNLKSPDKIKAIQKSIDKCLVFGGGRLIAHFTEDNKDFNYSINYTCPNGHITLPELTPKLFSFNSPEGACPECHGLGRKKLVDPKLVIPNPRLTLGEGAIRPWARMTNQTSWYDKKLNELATKYHFSLDTPIMDLEKSALAIVLYGNDDFEGVIRNLERRYHDTDSEYLRTEIEKYMVERVCPACNGRRLRPEALNVFVDGKNIADYSGLSISNALTTFTKLSKEVHKNTDLYNVATSIINEIIKRLKYLQLVGIEYLNLDRQADTLAGGEAQRIRLATQLSGELTDVLYVLDEPSIGLHPRDVDNLINTLTKLRDNGNSVIIVEHDGSIIQKADYIIDMGPGAGELGGEIIAEGTYSQILKNKASITGQYLSGQTSIKIPSKRRKLDKDNIIEILGAKEFNLKNIDVTIPLGLFVGITGVSGSGKSTLIYEILARRAAQYFYRAKTEPGKHNKITGLDKINKAINIDQTPIGRTPRSNLATYTGLFAPIRDLYAEQHDAKLKGFTASHFSFNLRGGRCENCHGDGMIKVEMHFLPDIYVTCEECHGKRYNSEALEITVKDKTIADVLDMTVDQAIQFFADHPMILAKLNILQMVGLGYLPLGQSATTLSGGEAQRIKLATELSRNDTGKTLYILDEPTTGLHFEDTKRLLTVIQMLVDKGNTVIVIEHNMDIIKSVDWIIDMGPSGGNAGGYVVAVGTPEQIARNSKSITGKYLFPALKSKSVRSRNN